MSRSNRNHLEQEGYPDDEFFDRDWNWEREFMDSQANGPKVDEFLPPSAEEIEAYEQDMAEQLLNQPEDGNWETEGEDECHTNE